MSPLCDLDLQYSNPIFLRDTLAHEWFTTCEVGLPKVKPVQEISSWQIFTTVLNYHCDHDLEHSNILQDTPPHQVQSQKIQTQKGSNERLFNTDTQYAHFQRNPLYQATKWLLNNR